MTPLQNIGYNVYRHLLKIYSIIPDIDYLYDSQQLKLIKQCIYYDFGDMLTIFKINLRIVVNFKMDE